MVIKIQPGQGLEILATGMVVMGRTQRLPNDRPNLVFLIGVRRCGNWIAGTIGCRDLSDLIAAAAILSVTKSRVIRIELYDGIAIGNRFIQVAGDNASIDVIG